MTLLDWNVSRSVPHTHTHSVCGGWFRSGWMLMRKCQCFLVIVAIWKGYNTTKIHINVGLGQLREMKLPHSCPSIRTQFSVVCAKSWNACHKSPGALICVAGVEAITSLLRRKLLLGNTHTPHPCCANYHLTLSKQWVCGCHSDTMAAVQCFTDSWECVNTFHHDTKIVIVGSICCWHMCGYDVYLLYNRKCICSLLI